MGGSLCPARHSALAFASGAGGGGELLVAAGRDPEQEPGQAASLGVDQ